MMGDIDPAWAFQTSRSILDRQSNSRTSSALPALESLSLWSCEEVSDAALTHLAGGSDVGSCTQTRASSGSRL